tara:strand:- start:1124 stop:2488 length:1365 start_codon:yes stop_codon:yes gene_type:complete
MNSKNIIGLETGVYNILDKYLCISQCYFLNKVDIVTNKSKEPLFASIIRMSCLCGKPYVAMTYVFEMYKKNITCKPRTFLPILDEFSNRGDIENTKCVFETMIDTSIQINEQAYCNVFYSIAKNMMILKSNADRHELIEYTDALITRMSENIHIVNINTALNIQSIYAFGLNWSFGECIDDSSGIFKPNKQFLRSIDINEKYLNEIKMQICDLVCTSKRRTEQFENFKSFLDNCGKIDIVIDGANIGFFKQNFKGGCFSHAQIDSVIDYFTKQNKRILLVLHSKWFNSSASYTSFNNNLSINQERIDLYYKKWYDKCKIYKVQRGNNDDWYWIYATLTQKRNNAFFLSNDKLRDHIHNIDIGYKFDIWKERHQINYNMYTTFDDIYYYSDNDCNNNEYSHINYDVFPNIRLNFEFTYPDGYSKRLQNCNNFGKKGWYMPVKEKNKIIWFGVWDS